MRRERKGVKEANGVKVVGKEGCGFFHARDERTRKEGRRYYSIRFAIWNGLKGGGARPSKRPRQRGEAKRSGGALWG